MVIELWRRDRTDTPDAALAPRLKGKERSLFWGKLLFLFSKREQERRRSKGKGPVAPQAKIQVMENNFGHYAMAMCIKKAALLRRLFKGSVGINR